jgi:hypothetical protein
MSRAILDKPPSTPRLEATARDDTKTSEKPQKQAKVPVAETWLEKTSKQRRSEKSTKIESTVTAIPMSIRQRKESQPDEDSDTGSSSSTVDQTPVDNQQVVPAGAGDQTPVDNQQVVPAGAGATQRCPVNKTALAIVAAVLCTLVVGGIVALLVFLLPTPPAPPPGSPADPGR